ncbi:translation initiation factor IF-2-like [Thrips palmi]|uniref:Translation initiation factor IF-2-like n=1 Tax=Thrips palmi TaxID=161013 RepID=A0A6P8YEB2_THRPL|nr:translation initiation factor IF-2-like [Thrips palmi]
MPDLTEEEVHEVLALVEGGMSARAVGRVFGKAHSVIIRVVHRFLDDGLFRRRPGQGRPKKSAAAKDAQQEGKRKPALPGRSALAKDVPTATKKTPKPPGRAARRGAPQRGDAAADVEPSRRRPPSAPAERRGRSTSAKDVPTATKEIKRALYKETLKRLGRAARRGRGAPQQGNAVAAAEPTSDSPPASPAERGQGPRPSAALGCLGWSLAGLAGGAGLARPRPARSPDAARRKVTSASRTGRPGRGPAQRRDGHPKPRLALRRHSLRISAG